ncbi:glycosyltransferase family 39 protein [Candidatus Viridilinea mediisalina]|nr:glycosyltransferase family 39 protein [Candidatus Viridilinea mediisalina]
MVILLCTSSMLWFALASAPAPRIDLGSPNDDRWLGGFHPAEFGEGAHFRWSGPGARLVFHGATRHATLLDLRLSGEYLVARNEPSIRLMSGGSNHASFEVAPGWRIYRLLLAPGAAATPWGNSQPLELETALSQPGVQADVRDYRVLGVALDWAKLTPLQHHALAALPQSVTLAWLLALSGGATAWLAQHWQRAAIGSASLSMLLGGIGLSIWAWLDPAGLVWALPPSPWLLGSASLLLIWLWLQRMPVLPEHALPRGAALGLVVVATGVALMHSQVAILVGLGLALLGMLLLARLPTQAGAAWQTLDMPISQRHALLMLSVIFLLALGLRLFRLDQLPFGLWRDEARHGLVALRMLEDPAYRPIYVLDHQVHLPGLGLYPFTSVIHLFGPSAWSLRIATAFAGALTIFPIYAVATRLTGQRALGLAAALFLATSSWHINVSRLAFPTVFEPLFTLSGIALLLFALANRRAEAHQQPFVAFHLLAALSAGICLGFALQTYHTGRAAPLVVAWLALLLLIHNPRQWQAWLVRMLLCGLGFIITTAPLGWYAIVEAEAFNDRVGQVFLLGNESLRGLAPLDALDNNLERHLLMFNALGDANGRHHAPLRPLFDIIAAMGLLLGLVALARNLHDWRTVFLLSALAIGILPGLFAVDAPHAMRTFGSLVPAYLIAVFGWAWALHLATPRLALRRFVFTVGVGALIVLNAGLYFVLMPPQVGVYLVFYPVQSQMGVYMRSLADEERLPPQIFVGDGLPQDPVFAFLTTGIPVETFAGSQLSTPAEPGAIFILSGYFLEDDLANLAPILGPQPEPIKLGPTFPDGSRRTFYVYEVSHDAH